MFLIMYYHSDLSKEENIEVRLDVNTLLQFVLFFSFCFFKVQVSEAEIYFILAY